MRGRIVKLHKNIYHIQNQEGTFSSKLSGKNQFLKNVPIVGDFVEFEPDGFINQILERKNQLIRPRIANIDQALIIMSLKEPNFSHCLLIKYLAIVEFNQINPILIFTKKDLDSNYLELVKKYESYNYKVIAIDNHNFSAKEFENIFNNKTTILFGQTGSGKTSLINNLTDYNFKTQEISKSLNRGKHTTTSSQMINFLNGFIVDTPGFSSFDLNLKPLELASSFKDFKEWRVKCFFKDCLHLLEKDCNVKQMVKNNDYRYECYVKLLKELMEK